MQTYKTHPKLSLRAIGKRVGANHKQVKHWIQVYRTTGNVKDARRSGRRSLLPDDAIIKVTKIAKRKAPPHLCNAARIADLLNTKFGVKASPQTIRRSFRCSGWKHGRGRKVPMLTSLHKQKRYAWAKKHLSKRTSFSSWLFTDSKLFLRQPTSSKQAAKIWYPPGGRPDVPTVQHSEGVHVYAGVTKFGVTKLIFVTGGGSKKSKHINPKTGKLHVGVGAREYQEAALPILVQGGDRIFQDIEKWATKWVFQQDNARPHTAKTTKAALRALVPGRFVDDWPPNSPDLNIMENVWSWVVRELNKRHKHFKDIGQLKTALQQVWDSIPPSMLQNCVRSMRNRLQLIVDNDGGNIG